MSPPEASARLPARRRRLNGSATALAAVGAIASASLGLPSVGWLAGSTFTAPGLLRRSRGVAQLSALPVKYKEEEPTQLYDEDGDADRVGPLSWDSKPKTPTLPASIFKPKASFSQNFICDPNYVFKMVKCVSDDSLNGKRVIELGPGTGALTARLFKKYPEMVGIELDQRALRVLSQQVPGVTAIRSDALLVNYTKLSEIRGGKLNIIGNLPFHVSTQILFTMCDHAASVDRVHVILQKEVAKRITARAGRKNYGSMSVIFQLYADIHTMFDLPPTAYFPRPSVETTLLEFDFAAAEERRWEMDIDPRDLSNLTRVAFRQRGKFLKNSLARLLACHTTKIDQLPEEYAEARAGFLQPWEFAHLTQLIFGKKPFPRHFQFSWRGEFGRAVQSD